MGNLTKKQHYVWRKYLKAWLPSGEDARIYTAFKAQNKVNLVALMGVGQQSYFYKMHELTKQDIDLIKAMVHGVSDILKGIMSDIATAYYSYTELKYLYRTDPTVKQKHPNIEQDIKEIEINTFEKIEGMIENMGHRLLECSGVDDLNKLEVDDGIQDALLYFFVQYGRTKNMYDRYVNGFAESPKHQSLIEHAFPFVSLYFAFELCHSTINSNWHITYVKNNTGIPFITSDQPIINYAYNEETDEGFELYYPISPVSAIILEVDAQLPQYSEYEADEKFVNSRNNKMWENAQLHVFANNEEVLKDFLNK